MNEFCGVYESKCFLARNLYQDRIKTAIEFAQIEDNHIILDIGCYKGRLLSAIRESNKNCECWGTDIEPRDLMIDNCQFRLADAINLPFQNNQFDVIFALSTLEHVKNVEFAIKEIFRVLKLFGIFILSSPTETLFYKFCRFLLSGSSKYAKTEVDDHYHNVYDIEKRIKRYNGFVQIQIKSLPNFPIPELHRVSKFKKIDTRFQVSN